MRDRSAEMLDRRCVLPERDANEAGEIAREGMRVDERRGDASILCSAVARSSARRLGHEIGEKRARVGGRGAAAMRRFLAVSISTSQPRRRGTKIFD